MAESAPDDAALSPLSQQPHLDEAMLSALPGLSDRKFLNSLSQRNKRRNRRRLQLTAGQLDTADGAPNQAGPSRDVTAAAAAAAAAAPLLDGGAAESAAPPPPPPEFVDPTASVLADAVGDTAEAQAEAADFVQDQMDALPSMVAHMEGRRMERQNLQYRMRTIAAKVPAGKRAGQSLHRMWSNLADLLASAFDAFTLGLYRTSFSKIEGNFGSGCASYFSFIRWLFVFNLCLSCIVFASCVFPYLLKRPGLTFEATLPPQLLADASVGQAIPDMGKANNCTRLAQDRVTNLTSDQTAWAVVTDTFTGGGWMLTFPIFLGAYFNKSESTLIPNTTDRLAHVAHFDTPVGMLLCLIALIACGVGAALNTSNALYRQTLKVSVRGSKRAKLSVELFTAWDYGLRARKAARMRRRTVGMRLRSMLLHLAIADQSRSPATMVARVLANIATLGMYCAAAYLIYYTTEAQSRLNAAQRRGGWRFSPTLRLVIDLMPQLTISLINVVVPIVLGKLIMFEYYSASMEILVQLGRVVFLKLLSFVTLIATIGLVLLCPDEQRDKGCEFCPGVETLCWETYVGQQLYRTLVIDVLICLLVTPTLDALRWLLNVKLGGRLFSKVPLSELLISNEVLGLVYGQSICFVGAFFCPFLLPIACLFYGCLFHVKRFTLRFISVSNKSFRSSRLERFFLDVLLLFLLVLLVPLCIAVLHIPPSRGCGPFRVHQSSQGYHMANSLSNWVAWSEANWLWDLGKLVYHYTVLNPTVHLLTLLLLLVSTYFFYSVVKARDTLIEFLEKKLQSESKIKLELANRELQLSKMRK